MWDVCVLRVNRCVWDGAFKQATSAGILKTHFDLDVLRKIHARIALESDETADPLADLLIEILRWK